jgi:hypothetical protein
LLKFETAELHGMLLCCYELQVYRTKESMKNAIFWEMTVCGYSKNRRFGGTYRLHHQGALESELVAVTLYAALVRARFKDD